MHLSLHLSRCLSVCLHRPLVGVSSLSLAAVAVVSSVSSLSVPLPASFPLSVSIFPLCLFLLPWHEIPGIVLYLRSLEEKPRSPGMKANGGALRHCPTSNGMLLQHQLSLIVLSLLLP